MAEKEAEEQSKRTKAMADFINESVEKINNSDYQEKAEKYAQSAEQDLKKVVSELKNK